MKYFPPIALLALVLFLGSSLTVRAQNSVCNAPAAPSGADTLIIDARPNQPNQSVGQNRFKKEARVAIINMNPFVYTYTVDTKQTEIKDTAHIGFLKLLGPVFTDLASNVTFESVTADASRGAQATTGNLEHLIRLTCTGGPARPGAAAAPSAVTCTAAVTLPTECQADTQEAREVLRVLSELTADMLTLRLEIENDLRRLEAGYNEVRNKYEEAKSDLGNMSVKEVLFDEGVTSDKLCAAVNIINPALTAPPAYPKAREVLELKGKVGRMRKLADEMRQTAEAFRNDSKYAKCEPRARGLRYIDHLVRLADVVRDDLNTAYLNRVDAVLAETRNYDYLKTAIAKLNENENMLLQRTFDVVGRFDISALDITVTPVKIRQDDAKSGERALETLARESGSTGDPGAIREAARERAAAGTHESSARPGGGESAPNGSNAFAGGARSQPEAGGTAGNGGQGNGGQQANGNGEAGEAPRGPTASAQIGNRRFELSGGLVYSSLERREFQPVLGFARNQAGELTDGQTLTKVVGVKENSEHRITPLVMLNTRLTNNPRYNLFFSLGITGKRDNAGTDIEYLLGPSFNLFSNNLFFTAGTYAGKQQRLAGDLFLNAKLPDNQSDIPVMKEFHWKPGFAITYRFPIKLPQPGGQR